MVGLKQRGQLSEVAFERQSALLRAERIHIHDELDRQNAVLVTLDESRAAIDTLERVGVQC